MTHRDSKKCFRWCETIVFPANEEGRPLTVKSAKHKFDSILAEAGITRDGYGFHERGPCLHCLRHVFAFKSFSQIEHEGISENDAIPYLSIYLGHDSLNETEKYLKFSSESFSQDMELFEMFFARPFWRKLQNIFGECCISKMEKVAKLPEGRLKPSGSIADIV